MKRWRDPPCGRPVAAHDNLMCRIEIDLLEPDRTVYIIISKPNSKPLEKLSCLCFHLSVVVRFIIITTIGHQSSEFLLLCWLALRSGIWSNFVGTSMSESRNAHAHSSPSSSPRSASGVPSREEDLQVPSISMVTVTINCRSKFLLA